MSNKIVEKLNGKSLFIKIDGEENKKDLKQTDAGIYIPHEVKDPTTQYRTATVLDVGEEIKDYYEIGDRIMLPPIAGEKEIDYNGKKLTLVQHGNVIAVL